MQTRITAWRWTLRLAASLGLALFVFFFALSFRVPEWVETFARNFIEREVRQDVNRRIDALLPPPGNSAAHGLAIELLERNRAQIETIKARLQGRSPDIFLVALDQVRDLSCECRERIEAAWRSMNATKLGDLLTDNLRLRQFIHASYMDVVHELRREIRIFTTINGAAFLLLLLVSFAKPQAARHLLFPGFLLLCATVLCAYLYVFSQDWLLTVIYGDYLGLAYLGYLGTVFLLLCDIALNRGRVTTEIVNGIGGMFGNLFAALSPC